MDAHERANDERCRPDGENERLAVIAGQWEHDLVSRPRDNIGEKFLGAAPHTNRKVFFEASPISYATADRNSTRFLLVHGTHDDIVDPAT